MILARLVTSNEEGMHSCPGEKDEEGEGKQVYV